MNHIKLAGLFCLILFGIIPSCIKNTATVEYLSGNSNQIVTPLNPVKRGEPFEITPVLPDSNASVRWTIRPSNNTELTLNGNQAMISISLAGNYAITANFYSPSNNVTPFDSSNYSIIVNDSLYTPPVISVGDSVLPIGAAIMLVPVSNSGMLGIIVQTFQQYNCTSSIEAIGFVPIAPLTTIFLYFDSARINVSKADCGGITNPATISENIGTLTIGVHPIYVELKQMYQGSVNVTDSDYTFTWPYGSGVTISPLQIKK